jgi:oligosaccharide repeat unit polymerase
MKAAFYICVGYSILGCLYAPGPSTFLALLFISLSCLPFLVAAKYEPRFGINRHYAPGYLLFWLVVLLGLANLAIIAVSVKESPLAVLSTDGFIAIAFASTTKRYGEQGSSGSPILLALSFFLVYRIAAADAIISTWRKVVGFVPLLLYSLLSTEKWPMYLSGIFFLSGLFISRPFREARGIALKYVITFTVLGVGLAGFALVLRGFNGDIIGLSAELLHYLLASFPAFGGWLAEEAARECCTFGAFSFIGPLDALGLIQREAGVYSKSFTIYGSETNIYTGWRYLVQDFSIIGPFFLNAAIGASFIAFNTIQWAAMSMGVRGFAIFGSLLSLNVTPFVHNSVAFAMILALMYSMYTVRPSYLSSPSYHS